MQQKSIWKSRKFLTMLVDAVVSLIALYVTQFLPPEQASLVIQTVAIVQVPVLGYIASTAYEDGQALRAGAHPSQQQKDE